MPERKLQLERIEANDNSATYLKVVLDSSQHGIMAFSSVRDVDGRIVDFRWELVNSISESLTGRTADNLNGKYLLVEMPGNAEDSLFDQYVKVVETGTPLDIEHYYEHEGIKTWFRITACKMMDGFVVTFADITESKHLQEQVKADYYVLDQFFNVTPDMLCISSVDGNFIKVNHAWTRTLGYTCEELEGQPFISFVHPDDVEKTLGAMEKLLQGEPVTQFQNRYRHANGTYRILDWHASPDPNGKIGYSAARDVTAEQAMQDKLAASEERFATAFKSSPVPMVLSSNIDGEPHFVDVNDAYLELTGYERHELIGQPMREIVLGMGVNSAQRDKRIQTLRTEGQYRMRELSLINRRGERRIVLISSTRMQLGDDTLTVEILLDVTEQRRAEETAFALRLEQARAEMITDFVQTSSHEFKTPLAIIQSSAYLMTRTDDKSIIAGKAVQIKHQVQRINKLVGMLQKIGKLRVEPKESQQPTSIEPVLERIVQRSQHDMLTLCNLTLTIDTDLDEICMHIGDVEDALWEIVSNAVQHRQPDTHTQIDVHASQNNAHVHIRISDNGKGILDTDIHNIYEPFFRVDQARTQAGWGLGLTLAKTVIERHGGTIHADSTFGVGSVFTVSLPVCADVYL